MGWMMDTMWTIIGVLLVQFALGGAYFIGYRMGNKKVIAPPASTPDPEGETDKMRMEQIQKAFRAVMSYDMEKAMKRRPTDG